MKKILITQRYEKIGPYKEIRDNIDVKNIKNIKNKIILIENADPGFDYIFSHKIAGLITKYGGSNSHMSIRCLELGIPAIIGIGEKNFESLLNSNNVYLDCKQKIFRITN
jgi:phosphohistidine swiveling domain-containing protein